MHEVPGEAIANTLARIVEHHGAAQRAVHRAHDTARSRPEPPATDDGAGLGDRRNPAQTDRTPRT